MATKKKKVRSHVKRVKLQQKKNPVSQEKYEKRLKVARKKDFFRRLRNVIVILAIAFCALFAAGNLMLKKATGQTLIGCMREAKNLVDSSTPDTFRLAQTSYIYSDDGTQLAALAESEDATYLSYEDIPADVVNAFVSVEDRTFWNNSGVDYKGILRVCVNYVKTKGQVAEGASTITQQLARGTFLSNEKTLSRKIKEIFIARQLTKKYTKEQIMEFYCNSCCFANGIYGVEDASQKYFGRSVSDLSLSETAYICAIPNRPEYYNPLKNSENAISRRNKILQDMYECDYITKDAGDAALAENITVAEVSDDTFYNYEATYAINCAIRYLMKQDGFEFKSHFEDDADYDTYNAYYDEMYKQAKHKLYTGGYKVTTTMNLKAQKNLQKIFDKELAFNTKVDESTGIYQFQGAMTVIDNETGKVVAMIGGRSQDELQQTYSLNRGFQSFKQPGSSIKPLVIYTPALEEGYDANSTLTEIDVKAAKKSTSEKISKMSGKKMSLRYAVEDSKNGCAYSLYNIITPKVGLSYIENMNFSKIVQQDYTLSSGLGGLHHGTNTVEMANAYSTLENHGEYRQADCISSILDASGNEIYEEPESKMVYTRSASDQMTDILEGVLNSSAGTAKGLKWSSASDVAAAAKTGTTNDNNVAWFCGYTPYYTISVWVGYDYPKSVKGLWGNTYPAYIWKEAMLYMIDGKDEADFDLEGKKATGNKNVISDEDDSSAPEESTDTSVTNPDDAQNTTDTNPSGGDHSTDSSTIDGNVPQGTEDISGGTISNSNKSESAGGSSESSSTGGESSGESDTTQ